MSVIYYVAVNAERLGPLTHLQVRQLIDAGEVTNENLAWNPDLDGWKPLGELGEFEAELHRADSASPPETGIADESRPIDEGEGPFSSPRPGERADGEDQGRCVDYPTDASSNDTSDPMLAAAAAADSPPQPFRIWTRVGARLVDTILLTTAACILFSLAGGALVSGLGMFFPLVLIASTFLMEAGLLCSFGTTPGKALLGITVRTARGEILSWGAALRRSLLVWLRGLGLGYPLFAVILAVFCYLEVKRRGTIIWDREQNLKVTYSNPAPASLAVAAAIVFGFLAIIAQSGVVGQTIHFMQTGEVPPGLELPEGFELPQRPGSGPQTPPALPQGPTA